MAKGLEDMTLEELWQLFPVELKPHDPQWKDMAQEEIASLQALLADPSLTISHIGSTAVPAIMAKPIIDILVEIPPGHDPDALRLLMEKAGYICMNISGKRMSFNKGYTPQGYAERVFHIHFHPSGDRDEILFRDYLISHPVTAGEYEKLKLSLLPTFKHDRDGYTAAKTDFVKSVVELARRFYSTDKNTHRS